MRPMLLALGAQDEKPLLPEGGFFLLPCISYCLGSMGDALFLPIKWHVGLPN